jgi:hypothetical protein
MTSNFVIGAIQRLIGVFKPYCRDCCTLDVDSRFWIVPNAFGLARSLSINDAEVVRAIMTSEEPSIT